MDTKPTNPRNEPTNSRVEERSQTIPPSSPTCARDQVALDIAADVELANELRASANPPLPDDWLLSIFTEDGHISTLGPLCDCPACLRQRDLERAAGNLVDGGYFRGVRPVNVVPIGAARERAMPYAGDVADMLLAGRDWNLRDDVMQPDGTVRPIDLRPNPYWLIQPPPKPTFHEHVDAYLEGLLPRSTFARLVVGGVLAFAAGVAIAAVVKAVSP